MTAFILSLCTWVNINLGDGQIPAWIYWQTHNPHKVIHYTFPWGHKQDFLSDSVIELVSKKPLFYPPYLRAALLNGKGTAWVAGNNGEIKTIEVVWGKE